MQQPTPAPWGDLQRQSGRLAWRYALLGIVWLAVSDTVGGWLPPGRGRDLYFATKGVVFVALSALFIHGLQHRAIRRFIESRSEIEDILEAVTTDKLAAVVGVTARTSEGRPIPLELLLLPFNTRAHMPVSLTGLMVSFVDGAYALTDLTLTSWRYMGHPPQRFAPRILRKLAVARGLMVYEGLV